MNVVDVVSGDGAERTAEAAHNAALLAERNVVATDEMVADGGTVPTVRQRPTNGADITFGRARAVVPFIPVFTQRDTRTHGMTDYVAFNDPTHAPVRANQSDLLCRRRCPRGGRVSQGEAANRDEIDTGLLWIKNRPADIDFHQVFVWVDGFELRP